MEEDGGAMMRCTRQPRMAATYEEQLRAQVSMRAMGMVLMQMQITALAETFVRKLDRDTMSVPEHGKSACACIRQPRIAITYEEQLRADVSMRVLGVVSMQTYAAVSAGNFLSKLCARRCVKMGVR